MEPSIPLKTEKKNNGNLVFCWGLAAEGQLGNGSFENSSIPVKSKLPVGKFVDVSAGGQFSGAVSENGDLYMWGKNLKYQLGLDDPEAKYSTPTKIKGVSRIVALACGDWHSVILDEEGVIHSVGYNKNGCLGFGDFENRFIFSPIKLPIKINKISAGRNVSLFLTEISEIFSCGIGYLNGNSVENIPAITPIKDLKNVRIINMSAGFNSCGCVDENGNLYTWGHSEDYQLGHGNKTAIFSPKIVEKLKNIKQVSCSRGEKHCHIGCVDASGAAFSWGSGYKAKLGHGNSKDQIVPKLIEYFVKENIKVKEFIAGGIHSSCLSEEGVLYTFGCGSDGRLGHPEKGNAVYLYKEKEPKIVEGLKTYFIPKVFSSYYHMIVLCSQ